MLTSGSKYVFGSAALALIAAFFVAVSTQGHNVGMAELTGPISFGYKGPVGSHFAYAILVAYAAVAILLGAILSVARDGDPEVGAELQGLDAPAAVMPVRGTNHWTIVAAFGGAMVVLGLVYSPELFILGLMVTGISAIQWTIYAWADRATADPYANHKVRHQLTYPLDFPLFAIIAIFLFVFAVSRILLAFPESTDVAVFGGIPALAFVVAIILSFRPRVPRNLIAVLAVVGSLIVIGLGIGGMVAGQATAEKNENTPHPYQLRGPSQGSLGAPISVRTAGEEVR